MYEQEITGRHRTAFVIAVDRSLSMSEKMFTECGRTVSKAEAVARAVNDLIAELENRAVRDGAVRNYYDISVLGYQQSGVEWLLGGGRRLVPVSELRRYAPERCRVLTERRTHTGESVLREVFADRWIEPFAGGCTPMYEAFWETGRLVGEWCSDPHNAGSFPPTVINITDGEASDCDPDQLRAASREIRRHATSDGNALLLNVHITSGEEPRTLLFPTPDEVGDDRYASLLADCSSFMPSAFNDVVSAMRRDDVPPPYIAMGYNASPKELFAMLNIGSRSVTGIR